MRIFDATGKEIVQVVCNACGKKIAVDNQVMKEEVLHVEKHWGYFSAKDGVAQEWDLCEPCYEKMIHGFVIPVQNRELTEMV